MSDPLVGLNAIHDFTWGSDMVEKIDLPCSETYEDIFNEINTRESNKKKIINVFKKEFNLNENVAAKITNDIFIARKTLTNDQAIYLKSTESCPFDIVVTVNISCCILKLVGTGEYSFVHKTLAIALDHLQQPGMPSSPSKPETMAIKKSKQINYSYSPEKKKIDSIPNLNKEGIDYPFATFKEKNGHGFSLNTLYNCTLTAFPFHKKKFNAVLCIIQALSTVLDELITFHDNGFIHRDIKGKNILVSTHGEILKSVLSDFGFFNEEIFSPHETLGTPPYLDPRMFGDVENTLINQKKKIGCQNKQGDLFALGQTIIHEILSRFIKEKSSLSLNKEEIIKQMEVIGLKGTPNKEWSDKELSEIGNSYPFRAAYSPCKKNDQMGIIIILPTLEVYKSFFSSIFNQFNDCLTQDQIIALTQISLLACDMVSTEWEKLPLSAREANDRLEAIHKSYNEAFSLKGSQQENESVSTTSDIREEEENTLKRKNTEEDQEKKARKRLEYNY